QVGFNLWCRHAAAYLKNALHQARPGRWRCEAYLVQPQARHLEAALDLPVRQCQRATPADLRLRQAYVQVGQIESLWGQAPGQAHVSPGPSWAPDVGLQVLQRTLKPLRAPLP